jgi:polysaccharide export outer membrane protein
MSVLCRGRLLILCTCFTAACQPTLHSDLPVGPAAYQTLEVSDQDTVNALTLLQPGDQINVNVFQEENLSTENAVIDQAGNVSLPLIGETRAAGLSPSQLSRAVEVAYGGQYLRNPRVNVVIEKAAPRVVSVEGQVLKAGVYEVQRGYTLLSALALAGSPTETAKLDEVLVFRQKDGQRMGGRFNVTDIRAGRAPDPTILPGDVIVVGYSQVRGAYLDFLKAAPIVGAFARY